MERAGDLIVEPRPDHKFDFDDILVLQIAPADVDELLGAVGVARRVATGSASLEVDDDA